MSSFSFNKIQKKTWSVEMPDGSIIHIKNPTKADSDLLAMVLNSNNLDEIFSGVAYILSCNTEGKKFKQSDIDGLFDYADIQAFLNGYAEFLQSLSKN